MNVTVTAKCYKCGEAITLVDETAWAAIRGRAVVRCQHCGREQIVESTAGLPYAAILSVHL